MDGLVYDRDSLLGINKKLTEKQDVLTFDSTPTENSNNPVTSGGVYLGLSGKSNLIHTHSANDIIQDTLSVSRGGTGTSSFNSGEVLLGAGSSALTTRAIDTTSGGTSSSNLLITSGAVYSGLSEKAPSSHNHAASNITSGTLGVSRGGTGRSSVTANSFLVGNGTGALVEKTSEQVKSLLNITGSTISYSLVDTVTGTFSDDRSGTDAQMVVTLSSYFTSEDIYIVKFYGTYTNPNAGSYRVGKAYNYNSHLYVYGQSSASFATDSYFVMKANTTNASFDIKFLVRPGYVITYPGVSYYGGSSGYDSFTINYTASIYKIDIMSIVP